MNPERALERSLERAIEKSVERQVGGDALPENALVLDQLGALTLNGEVLTLGEE